MRCELSHVSLSFPGSGSPLQGGSLSTWFGGAHSSATENRVQALPAGQIADPCPHLPWCAPPTPSKGPWRSPLPRQRVPCTFKRGCLRHLFFSPTSNSTLTLAPRSLMALHGHIYLNCPLPHPHQVPRRQRHRGVKETLVPGALFCLEPP